MYVSANVSPPVAPRTNDALSSQSRELGAIIWGSKNDPLGIHCADLDFVPAGWVRDLAKEKPSVLRLEENEIVEARIGFP